MNTIDREMIREAADLLRRASADADSGHFLGADWMAQSASWFERALGFRMLTVAEATVPVARDPGGRWRPIDTAGTVSPDPAPETPDEADEGETGPAEARL